MRKLLIALFFVPLFVNGQTNNWIEKIESEQAFIKNEGQFEGRNWQSSNKIEYAIAQNPYYIFFTKKGLTYRLDKFIRNPKRVKGDPNSPKRTNVSELIHVTWLDANPNVEIVSEGKIDEYYSYAMKDSHSKKITNLNHVPGYEKIIYKNLYDKIDVEYFFHPNGGIKYSIILHPGADPSQIKMQYKTEHTNVKQENISINLTQYGEINIYSSLGNITEHKPYTYYNNSKAKINSQYKFSNNILSFKLDNYDNSKEVVIDPWMVVETFNSSNAVWEVETDGVGNVYVIGGETPMVLKKYNSAGALQWTYNTPWDTNSVWLGTLATDAGGTSYVTSGVSAEMHKVDNAGNFVWQTAPSGGLEFQSEWWSITFNCDETKLIVGGTWVNGILSFDFYGGIFDIDVATGSVLNAQKFTHVNISGFGNTPQEVRSISSSKNAKYIFLTHDSVGAINQDIGLCPTNTPIYQVDNTHHLAYKCENYLPESQNGGGLKALVANDNYYYTHKGDQILQWDVTNGALLNTVSLPGGSSNTDIFGDIVVHCSGLDVDVSGNVYAGSMDRVVKFDANLNILSQAMTTNSFTVYDVSVNSTGEVVATGAEGNNTAAGNRVGRIESFNMNATGQYALVCCDANFCPVDPLCTSDAPITMSPNTGGGTWSSSPVTAGLNTGTGVFDPSVAGIGTYTITYTLACGTNSTVIQVINCSALTVCVETNGDLTVTGGTGPYNWDEWVPAATTPITNSAECTACGGTWQLGSCFNPFPIPLNDCSTPAGWSNFGTGVTVTPPVGADTVQVTDNFGNNLVMYDISTLSPCSGCDATITQVGPFCINMVSVPSNLIAVDPGGIWSGNGIIDSINGTFDPATSGVGSFVITYTLACGDTDTTTIVVNALDSVGFSYSQGTYCLTDPNPTPTNTGLSGGTYTINNGGTINPSTGEINISASGAGSYTVTYTTNGACPNSGTFNITLTSGANATITQVSPVCVNSNNFITLSAVDPGGVWSGSGVTGASFDPVSAGVGSHVITYTISGSCGDTDTMTIVVNAADTAAFNYSTNSFCSTDPNPTPTITGTTGGTFTIDNGGTITAATGQVDIALTGIGNYIVTYITNGSCPDTATLNITINNCSLPQPIADFTASLTNICEGDCINFTDLSTSTVSGGITNWSWSFTGSSTATSTVQNPTNICYPTAGSYQVMLTVTDANGTDDTTMVNYINVNSCTLPTAGFAASDDTICENECIDFIDQSTGSTSWLWTFNGGTPNSSTNQNPPNICFNTSGNYNVEQIVTNSNGSDTATSTVVVNASPSIYGGTDVIIELGQSTTLNATGTNGDYTWSPPTWLDCIYCTNPVSTPEETITYTVIVSDSNGCTASDEVTVFVDFENVIFVPNIFSPNGDDHNDVLYVRGKGVASLQFFIYDRWGEKVFETSSLDDGWDGTFRGKKMNNGVFVYYLKATFTDGNEATQKGDITLIR